MWISYNWDLVNGLSCNLSSVPMFCRPCPLLQSPYDQPHRRKLACFEDTQPYTKTNCMPDQQCALDVPAGTKFCEVASLILHHYLLSAKEHYRNIPLLCWAECMGNVAILQCIIYNSRVSHHFRHISVFHLSVLMELHM